MRFLLDHDVPADLALLLRCWRHAAEVERVDLNALLQGVCLADAAARASHAPYANPLLLRRRSRQLETSRLLTLLKNAGEQGLHNNINFA